MRIAISGVAGTGKSTLAKALSQRLSLPLIEEGYDNKISRGKGKKVELWEQEYLAVLAEKTASENQYTEFIADRCPLDLMNGWMNNLLHTKVSAEKTQKFLNLCLKEVARYDFVVITPWNSIPFVEREKDRPGIRRNPNPFVLLRSQASTIGIAHMFLDKRRIIEIPRLARELSVRVDYVCRQLERRHNMLSSESRD